MSKIYIKYKDHFYNILLNLRTISEHKHKRCLLIGSAAHTSSPTSMLIRSRSGRRAQREGRMHVEVSEFVWTTADAATVFLQAAYITACAFKPPPVTRSVRCVWVCISPLTHSTLWLAMEKKRLKTSHLKHANCIDYFSPKLSTSRSLTYRLIGQGPHLPHVRRR